MPNNSQSRKWILTINNPLECGLNREAVCGILMKFSPDYFCLCSEVATAERITRTFSCSACPRCGLAQSKRWHGVPRLFV